MSFTHLHVHTEYSLLDGSNKINEYVARVKELGMTAAAITDHGVMYGVIDFYKAAKAAGIRPVLGCEVYVAPGSRFDRETSHGEGRYYHLVLLAQNNQGYSNLIMEAAKSAGAGGGTVIHARGTGMERAESFFGVSLASEKEIIFIVSRTGQRNGIMKAVMKDAGMESKAKSIIFSLPVTSTAGLRLVEDEQSD